MLNLVLGSSYEDLLPQFTESLSKPRDFASIREQVVTPEWVITPSIGVRRWLITEVANSLGAQPNRTDGIVANWTQEFPSKLVSRILDEHLNDVFGISSDPWSLPQLQFSIYDWATANPTGQGAELVCDSEGRPSLSRSRQYADLFDRYFTWRPEMIRAWASSNGTIEEADQQQLWLSIREFINVPSSPERWSEAWQWLLSNTHILPATDRLSVFGLASFPGGPHYVEALNALSKIMDVTVYDVRPFDASVSFTNYVRDEFTSNALQMWGGFGLSKSELLAGLLELNPNIVDVSKIVNTSSTILSSVQRMLRSDVASPITALDSSVIVHNCHGESRQAEVLRDSILHELEEKPELSESDILVVCPNIVRFEPLIRSAFGSRREGATNDPQPQLAYRIADRSISHEGFYLQAVQHFLSLIRSRCIRSELLGFLSEPAVMRARSVSDDAQELYASWTEDSGVRWGLNAAHRAHFGLGSLGSVNTWEAGLQRLKYGVFMENPRLRASKNILPVEIAPAHFEDLVALAATVELLTESVEESWSSRTLSQWLEWFDKWSRTFVLPDPSETKEFERVLGAIKPLRDAGIYNNIAISYADFLNILDEALGSIGSVGALFTGGVTITSPETLRGVAFKSIYILGFDEEAFTAAELERADLRRQSYAPGDIAPSDEARERLRETILSAKDRLTIIRSGNDISSNRKIEPGVAFSEFLEAIGAVVVIDGAVTNEPLTIIHPRNSFSSSNFDPEDKDFFQHSREFGITRGSWSFSTLNHELASTKTRTSWKSHLEMPYAVRPLPSELSARDLELFLKNPPRIHAQATLGIFIPEVDENETDELDAKVSSILKASTLRELWEEERTDIELRTQTDLDAAIDSLIASGDLPPDSFFSRQDLIALAEGFAKGYLDGISRGERRHRKISLDVGTTTLVTDLDVIQEESCITLVEVLTSGLRVKNVLAIWLRVLFLRASTDENIVLHLVYKDPEAQDVDAIVTWRHPIASGVNVSMQILTELANLYRANLSLPIPYAADEKSKYYQNPTLPEDKWTHTEFVWSSYEKYLGDPYWALTMGHISRDEVLGDTSVTGHRGFYEKIIELLDLALPMYSFATGSN